MWNGIRTFADLMHLLSFIIILYKLISQRNCQYVSLKTQEIYLVVFAARYLDLFMYYVSLYNTTMKLAFLSSTILIIYIMRFKSPICEVKTFFNKLDLQPKRRLYATSLADSFRFHYDYLRSHPVYYVGAHLVLFSVAWSSSYCSSDYNY